MTAFRNLFVIFPAMLLASCAERSDFVQVSGSITFEHATRVCKQIAAETVSGHGRGNLEITCMEAYGWKFTGTPFFLDASRTEVVQFCHQLAGSLVGEGLSASSSTLSASPPNFSKMQNTMEEYTAKCVAKQGYHY